jgi:hypothetical protein
MRVRACHTPSPHTATLAHARFFPLGKGDLSVVAGGRRCLFDRLVQPSRSCRDGRRRQLVRLVDRERAGGSHLSSLSRACWAGCGGDNRVWRRARWHVAVCMLSECVHDRCGRVSVCSAERAFRATWSKEGTRGAMLCVLVPCHDITLTKRATQSCLCVVDPSLLRARNRGSHRSLTNKHTNTAITNKQKPLVTGCRVLFVRP